MSTTTTPVRASGDLTVEFSATQADATLLVQILNGPVSTQAAEGMHLLWAYDETPTYEQLVTDHPRGSQGYKDISAVLNLNETIGTFVKQGLLNRGLVYDLLWVRGSWERCRPLALQLRQQAGVPQLFENFEALAQGQPG